MTTELLIPPLTETADKPLTICCRITAAPKNFWDFYEVTFEDGDGGYVSEHELTPNERRGFAQHDGWDGHRPGDWVALESSGIYVRDAVGDMYEKVLIRRLTAAEYRSVRGRVSDWKTTGF